jgi:hypothetical protein
MVKVSEKIDRLTNSIVNTNSGDSFDTDVVEFYRVELGSLKKGWKFDWSKEFKNGVVFKLVIRHYPEIVQGLISIIDKNDHLYMNLVESAPHNFGKNKTYEGVLGNLVAFACKLSLEKGYEGYVAFEPKTALIEHYKKTLKAKLISNNRMIIETKASMILINKYYNK